MALVFKSSDAPPIKRPGKKPIETVVFVLRDAKWRKEMAAKAKEAVMEKAKAAVISNLGFEGAIETVENAKETVQSAKDSVESAKETYNSANDAAHEMREVAVDIATNV